MKTIFAKIFVLAAIAAVGITFSSATFAGTEVGNGYSPAVQNMTHTVSVNSDYYIVGPQQAAPPNGVLKAGTRVAIVRNAGSYVQVISETGVRGYIGASAIKRLSF